MKGRSRIVLSAIVVVTAAAAMVLFRSPSVAVANPARVAEGCWPYAAVPAFVSAHSAYAKGYVDCNEAYYWSLSLRNRAGNSLITSDGYFASPTNVATPAVTCTGAYIHSFLYINVSGVGKSDTGPEAGLC
jgi:hypothetical protein